MRRLVVAMCTAGLVWAMTPSAAAVHLFPLFPGDPTGDCAAALEPDPGDADASVTLEGFFFFSPSVEIEVGQSVTWEWILYCHSVTSTSVPPGAEPFTTFGGAGSATGPPEGEDELVRPEGDAATFTVSFTVPGTYEYMCVHHASVGMVGEVVVTEAEPDEGAEPDDGPSTTQEVADGEESAEALDAAVELPVTGGGAVGAGLALAGLGAVGVRARLRRGARPGWVRRTRPRS